MSTGTMSTDTKAKLTRYERTINTLTEENNSLKKISTEMVNEMKALSEHCVSIVSGKLKFTEEEVQKLISLLAPGLFTYPLLSKFVHLIGNFIVDKTNLSVDGDIYDRTSRLIGTELIKQSSMTSFGFNRTQTIRHIVENINPMDVMKTYDIVLTNILEDVDLCTKSAYSMKNLKTLQNLALISTNVVTSLKTSLNITRFFAAVLLLLIIYFISWAVSPRRQTLQEAYENGKQDGVVEEQDKITSDISSGDPLRSDPNELKKILKKLKDVTLFTLHSEDEVRKHERVLGIAYLQGIQLRKYDLFRSYVEENAEWWLTNRGSLGDEVNKMWIDYLQVLGVVKENFYNLDDILKKVSDFHDKIDQELHGSNYLMTQGQDKVLTDQTFANMLPETIKNVMILCRNFGFRYYLAYFVKQIEPRKKNPNDKSVFILSMSPCKPSDKRDSLGFYNRDFYYPNFDEYLFLDKVSDSALHEHKGLLSDNLSQSLFTRSLDMFKKAVSGAGLSTSAVVVSGTKSGVVDFTVQIMNDLTKVISDDDETEIIGAAGGRGHASNYSTQIGYTTKPSNILYINKGTASSDVVGAGGKSRGTVERTKPGGGFGNYYSSEHGSSSHVVGAGGKSRGTVERTTPYGGFGNYFSRGFGNYFSSEHSSSSHVVGAGGGSSRTVQGTNPGGGFGSKSYDSVSKGPGQLLLIEDDASSLVAAAGAGKRKNTEEETQQALKKVKPITYRCALHTYYIETVFLNVHNNDQPKDSKPNYADLVDSDIKWAAQELMGIKEEQIFIFEDRERNRERREFYFMVDGRLFNFLSLKIFSNYTDEGKLVAEHHFGLLPDDIVYDDLYKTAYRVKINMGLNGRPRKPEITVIFGTNAPDRVQKIVIPEFNRKKAIREGLDDARVISRGAGGAVQVEEEGKESLPGGGRTRRRYKAKTKSHYSPNKKSRNGKICKIKQLSRKRNPPTLPH